MSVYIPFLPLDSVSRWNEDEERSDVEPLGSGWVIFFLSHTFPSPGCG